MERHQARQESEDVTPRFLRDFAALRPLIKGTTVLELEPGSGRALELLRAEGFETEELECNEFHRKGYLPKTRGSIDSVFSRYMLERSLYPDALARESFRIAKHSAAHLVALKSTWHSLSLETLRKLLPDWEIEELPEIDCAIVWRAAEEGESSGESHEKVPRKETVERNGQTFEETYWVSPDWYKSSQNLEGMKDRDVTKTYHSIQGLLADRHQAVVEAQKAGASQEEIDKLKLAEHNAYHGRRNLGREVKKRGLPSDMAPVRTEARSKAVEGRGEEIVPDHPSGSVARATQEIGFTQAEESRYTGDRATGSNRGQFFEEFLEGRDIPNKTYRQVFPASWGTFRDAPLAMNAAMGELMGHSMEDMAKHIPAFRRAQHDPETLQRGTQVVKKVLPAVAAWSRNYYKQQGKDTIEIFRGVRGGSADAIDSQLSRGGGSVDLGTNPVSQWVTDKRYADAAAKGGRVGGGEAAQGKGYVISMEVPVDRVVFSREATGDSGAPEVLINTGFDEVFRVPKESIESVESPRGEEDGRG